MLETQLETDDTHLILFGNRMDEEIRSHVIHVGHENAGEIGDAVLWVDVFIHSLTPVFPVTWKAKKYEHTADRHSGNGMFIVKGKKDS